MTKSPTSRQSANIFKNYNRIIGAAYALLIIALVVFFGYLLHRKMFEEIGSIRGDVARHGQFFEFVLRASADQLEIFRMSASASPGNPGIAAGPALFSHPPGSWLRTNSALGQFSLDDLPNRDSGGNLVGLGRLKNRSRKFYRDLDTALRLNIEWSSLMFNLPNASEARFVSVHQFHAVLPWQQSQDIPFHPGVYDSPVWTMGQPAQNPDREKYWAPVYFGGEARGLLAPVAAPVYDDQRFVGVLSIETSVDYLNRINADFNYPLGFTFLINQHQQVLAHPELYAKPLEVNATPSLASALPQELKGELDRLVLLPSGRPEVINGYLVIRYALISAPWSLFYVAPQSALWLQLAYNMGTPMVGVLLGLALLMALTYMVTSREFVGPAAKLVQHIAAESNFEPTTIPAIPSGWRPWFETITRAFHESMQFVALRKELGIAASMQQSILPRHWPSDPRYTLWGTMRPAKDVGGDFYDHFELAGGQRGIVVADVSGKGISAGLFGMVSKTLLRSLATHGRLEPGEMVSRVNDGLCEDNEACMFVTTFYGQYDPATGKLLYTNAGHLPPLLVHDDGRIAWLPTTSSVALGVMEGLDYPQAMVELQPGALLLMYTDGVNEAMNAANEEFGMQRLAELFAGHPAKTPQDAVARVLQAVEAHAQGVEQSDDITCVALYCLKEQGYEAGQGSAPACLPSQEIVS